MIVIKNYYMEYAIKVLETELARLEKESLELRFAINVLKGNTGVQMQGVGCQVIDGPKRDTLNMCRKVSIDELESSLIVDTLKDDAVVVDLSKISETKGKVGLKKRRKVNTKSVAYQVLKFIKACGNRGCTSTEIRSYAYVLYRQGTGKHRMVSFNNGFYGTQFYGTSAFVGISEWCTKLDSGRWVYYGNLDHAVNMTRKEFKKYMDEYKPMIERK
jgi:hypothetical protein